MTIKEGVPLNYRWIVEFVLLPVLFLGFGAWMTSMNAQIANINKSITELEIRSNTSITNLSNISPRLDRIEDKLDAVIDRQIPRGI